MKDIKIEKVLDNQLKEKITEEILLNLPEWFGLPDSINNYVEEAKKLPLWVAKDKTQNIGFITLSETSIACGEVHCMGVKKKYHGQGIGTLLMNTLENAASKKYEYLQVKTVDEGHYKEYDQTIAFYKKMGFKKLEVFPTLWDKWNPCLIMVKHIE